nr:hypothetical protein [Bacilli bacterium]
IPIFLYQKFKMNKNIFMKIFITLPIVYFVYIIGYKDIYNLLPFIALLVEIYLVPELNNNKKVVSISLRCILLMTYFYHNNLILLFILETIDLAFMYGYMFIKKIVRVSDRGTSPIGKL